MRLRRDRCRPRSRRKCGNRPKTARPGKLHTTAIDAEQRPLLAEGQPITSPAATRFCADSATGEGKGRLLSGAAPERYAASFTGDGNSCASLVSPFGVIRAWVMIFSEPSERCTVVVLCSISPCWSLVA